MKQVKVMNPHSSAPIEKYSMFKYKYVKVLSVCWSSSLVILISDDNTVRFENMSNNSMSHYELKNGKQKNKNDRMRRGRKEKDGKDRK